MNAVPPQARLPRSVKSSCLPASSIVLLSFLVQPRGDAGRGEHQHRVERVHDLLQSLHENSPVSESRKMPTLPHLCCEAPGFVCSSCFSPFKSITVESADSCLFLPSNI